MCLSQASNLSLPPKVSLYIEECETLRVRVFTHFAVFVCFWLRWVFTAARGLSPVVACRLSCPVACKTFPDQGSNLCLLHWLWQAILNHWTTRMSFIHFYRGNNYTTLQFLGFFISLNRHALFSQPAKTIRISPFQKIKRGRPCDWGKLTKELQRESKK